MRGRDCKHRRASSFQYKVVGSCLLLRGRNFSICIQVEGKEPGARVLSDRLKMRKETKTKDYD